MQRGRLAIVKPLNREENSMLMLMQWVMGWATRRRCMLS